MTDIVKMSNEIQSAQDQQATRSTQMQAAIAAALEANNLDQVSKFMDLMDRWDRKQAKSAFDAAMANFKAECPAVVKSHQVAFKQTKYAFAKLGDISAAIDPVLCKYGLSYRYEPSQGEVAGQHVITVKCILSHTAGHQEAAQLSAPIDTSGSKNPIQAIGSTTTYLQRYTLMLVSGVATNDMDNDGHIEQRNISDDQVQALMRMAQENGHDIAEFLKNSPVNALSEIPASDFQFAASALSTPKNGGGE